MSTYITKVIWIEPFTDGIEIESRRGHYPFSGAGVADLMTRLEEERCGLGEGESAGYTPVMFIPESETIAAFVLQTRGLSHNRQLLLVGKMMLLTD